MSVESATLLQRADALGRLGCFRALRLIFMRAVDRLRGRSGMDDADYRVYSVIAFLNANGVFAAVSKDRRHVLDCTLPYGGKVSIRAMDSDFLALHQIFVRQDYDVVIKIFREHFADTPTCIIDVGANVGLASLYFRLHFPDVRIVAVEPDPGNVEMLRHNMRLAGDQVLIIPAAIWPRDTGLVMQRDFRDAASWSARVAEPGPAEVPSLRGVTFSNLLAETAVRAIDILKIDIEGSEAGIFGDAQGLQELLRVTKTIIVEVHEEFISREAVVQRLQENGFHAVLTRDGVAGWNTRIADIP